MANKPHLFFRNPVEGVKTFRQRPRYPGAEEDEEIEEEIIDYTLKTEDFVRSLDNFNRGREARIASRNANLRIPAHIDYIEIKFHNYFDNSFFENRYRVNFGLSVISYSALNSVVVFAVTDAPRFQDFISNINIFIATENHSGEVRYNKDIKYIKEFTCYTSDRIIRYQEFKPHVIINLVDNVELFQNFVLPVERTLLEYIRNKGITVFEDLVNNKIELLNVDEATIREIVNNFDVVQAVNAYAAGIVRPNAFNMVERTFGFEITNSDEDLPIIGVVDTGISNQTPLAALIINQGNEFDITGSSPVTDAASHGTAVAAFASLGDKLHPNHVGRFAADAKLLSIKILDASGGYIPEAEVIRMIKEAHEKYGVQIFTLTIGYTKAKFYNEIHSEYAYALDVLSYQLNILIFISIGNAPDNLQYYSNNRFVTVNYPDHFDEENRNLFSPAESMNNLTVGAVAGNLENNDQACVSPDGSFPAIYTRTHHITWNHPLINKTRINKRLYKPDICYYGGDFDEQLGPERAGLKVLSTAPGLFYIREIGTSYANPLTANIAARLIKQYPDLTRNMQTVKAIMLNGAQDSGIDKVFGKLENTKFKAIYGNGIPDVDSIANSNDNRVTFILEDEIRVGQIKSYTLNIPEYLLDANKENGLLHVDATLCFKFMPIKNNQLAYCPIHLTFGIFRNLPLEDYRTEPATVDTETGEEIPGKRIAIGINDNKMDNLKFSEPWAQDYYYKAKMLSNAQKLSFNISKKVLQEENCILKIAVNAKLHKLISQLQQQNYQGNHAFSLVFTIRENPIKGVNTNQLYDQLITINQVEALNTLDTDLEAEA